MLVNEKISVGEYINAKWRNLYEPFGCKDAEAVRKLSVDIQTFEAKTHRPVVFEGYRGNTRAVELLEDAIRKYK